MKRRSLLLAVMQMVESDLVELDAPIDRYLPEFRVADVAALAALTGLARVAELVRHTANERRPARLQSVPSVR